MFTIHDARFEDDQCFFVETGDDDIKFIVAIKMELPYSVPSQGEVRIVAMNRLYNVK